MAGENLLRYEEKSKYIRTSRERTLFRGICILFVINMYVMPQYFGIPLPFFDLTVLRLSLLMLATAIFADRARSRDFLQMLHDEPLLKVLLPYVFVIFYTMVLRADINAFFNPFIEIVTMFLMIYVIRYTLGVKGFVRLITGCVWVIAILGIVEYIMQNTPFLLLLTIPGQYTGRIVRSGQYRIMSSAVHSLGFGMMIETMLPFAVLEDCGDRFRVNYMKRPLLVFLLFLDMILTGSRSSLGALVAELLLLFFFQEKKQRKLSLIAVTVFLVFMTGFLILFQKTSLGNYIMMQLAVLVDSVFNTNYAVRFGAENAALNSSSNYRESMKGIWTVSWLNPVLGLGRKRSFAGEVNGSFIYSVDQFYLAEYIRYAWPGLICYMVFLARSMWVMVQGALRGSAAAKALLAGAVCYLANMYYVDALQTLKYLYTCIAISAVLVPEYQEEKKKTETGDRKDRWRKKRKLCESV